MISLCCKAARTVIRVARQPFVLLYTAIHVDFLLQLQIPYYYSCFRFQIDIIYYNYIEGRLRDVKAEKENDEFLKVLAAAHISIKFNFTLGKGYILYGYKTMMIYRLCTMKVITMLFLVMDH